MSKGPSLAVRFFFLYPVSDTSAQFGWTNCFPGQVRQLCWVRFPLRCFAYSKVQETVFSTPRYRPTYQYAFGRFRLYRYSHEGRAHLYCRTSPNQKDFLSLILQHVKMG